MARGTSHLVGRDAELGILGDAVASARDGACIVAILEGDAGLGKSRLVGDALASYRGPTDAVGLGYGVELTGPEIPYRVTTDLLRTLCRDVGAEAVQAAAGAYAPALRPLHPVLADDGDGDANPSRVLPAFVATVEQLAADRLVWLVIEDLPWVDAPTRDLLAYLVRVARASQLIVLLTVRTHDPVTDPAVVDLVESLARLEGVTRLVLRPLGPGQIADLVANIAAEATGPQVARIVRDAHGSPLLAEQLVATGLDKTDATGVEDPMTARIRRLDPDTLRLVQLAALGEGHLEHRLLAVAYDAPEGVFDAAVDRALAVRLLQYRTEGREFMFAHPLLRHAAEGTLTPGERLRGHRRWGSVLSSAESHHGEPQLLIAAAHHWAATDDDAETFTAALAASRETRRLGAATQTADLLLHAWNLWDRVPNAAALADRPRDHLCLDLADALQSADRLAEVVPLIDREVGRSAGVAGSDRVRLLCLRLFADDVGAVLGEPEDESLYREAVELVEDLLTAPASRLLVPALNGLGWHLRWTDTDLVDRLFDRALAVSREACGSAEIAFTASQVARQRVGRGMHEEALAVSESALEACRSVADYQDVERARGAVLAQSGRLRDSLTQLERTLARLPDPQLSPTEWVFVALDAVDCCIALGDWQRAELLIGQCDRLDVREWAVRVWVDTAACRFASARGDVEESARRAEESRQRLGAQEEGLWDFVVDAVRDACARVAAVRGEYEQAHRLLEPVLLRPGKESAAMMWPVVALAAEVEGDRAAKGSGTTANEPVAVVASAVEGLPRSGPYLNSWYLHARADLARARGSESAHAWADVCDGWRGLGHVPNLGWASYRLAAVLIPSNDRTAAAAALSEAWQIGDRLGATPLRDAALGLSRRARIPIDSGTARATDGGGRRDGRLGQLTDRELEVLRHVASGRSNNEIAAALFISPKTASVHISHILTKLDVTTRTAAATVALQAGLDVHPV